MADDELRRDYRLAFIEYISYLVQVLQLSGDLLSSHAVRWARTNATAAFDDAFATFSAGVVACQPVCHVFGCPEAACLPVAVRDATFATAVAAAVASFAGPGAPAVDAWADEKALVQRAVFGSSVPNGGPAALSAAGSVFARGATDVFVHQMVRDAMSETPMLVSMSALTGVANGEAASPASLRQPSLACDLWEQMMDGVAHDATTSSSCAASAGSASSPYTLFGRDVWDPREGWCFAAIPGGAVMPLVFRIWWDELRRVLAQSSQSAIMPEVRVPDMRLCFAAAAAAARASTGTAHGQHLCYLAGAVMRPALAQAAKDVGHCLPAGQRRAAGSRSTPASRAAAGAASAGHAATAPPGALGERATSAAVPAAAGPAAAAGGTSSPPPLTAYGDGLGEWAADFTPAWVDSVVRPAFACLLLLPSQASASAGDAALHNEVRARDSGGLLYPRPQFALFCTQMLIAVGGLLSVANAARYQRNFVLQAVDASLADGDVGAAWDALFVGSALGGTAGLAVHARAVLFRCFVEYFVRMQLRAWLVKVWQPAQASEKVKAQSAVVTRMEEAHALSFRARVGLLAACHKPAQPAAGGAGGAPAPTIAASACGAGGGSAAGSLARAPLRPLDANRRV
jgi:hypothetical protein